MILKVSTMMRLWDNNDHCADGEVYDDHEAYGDEKNDHDADDDEGDNKKILIHQ